jgi:hypothetical protein
MRYMLEIARAGDRVRTDDMQLGKLPLCQLSYTRLLPSSIGGYRIGLDRPNYVTMSGELQAGSIQWLSEQSI